MTKKRWIYCEQLVISLHEDSEESPHPVSYGKHGDEVLLSVLRNKISICVLFNDYSWIIIVIQ